MIKRDCFIIARIGTKLAPLANLVCQAGWRILNFEAIEPGESPLIGSAEGLIGAADAVIVILDDQLSPNIMFEVGLAYGRGCPLLLVSVSDAGFAAFEQNPVLATLPRVRAKLTDISALRFHVTAFLEGVEKGTVSQPTSEDRGRPLPGKRLGHKEHVSAPKSSIERRLFEALERAPEVSAVHYEPRLIDGRRDFVPDFAVWLSDDRTFIVNPMLVEVTGILSESKLRHVLSRMQRYAVEIGIGAIMLVEDRVDKPLTIFQLSPMIFRIGLTNLEELLARGKMLSEMTNARNLRFHGLR